MGTKLWYRGAAGTALALLFVAGAWAQQRQQLPGKKVDVRGGKVMIDGQEDRELTQLRRRVNNRDTFPADDFFRRMGIEERKERGWIPKDSRDRDRDREAEWRVVRRGGHEYRWRPGDRRYYYDGSPRWFSYSPYRYGDRDYLSWPDLSLLLGLGYGGSRYGYDPYYGQYPSPYYPGYYDGNYDGYRELSLTYPFANQSLYDDRIPVQGWTTPNTRVRIQLYGEGWYPYGNRRVSTTSTRANDRGLFATTIRAPRRGSYRLEVETMDRYGRVQTEQFRRIYVR